MSAQPRRVVLLLAEDDDDDYLMFQEALAEARVRNQLSRVRDGEELIDYLKGVGAFQDRTAHPSPDLVILDLNMPRKNGREALRDIRADPGLRHVPVVILTTSKAEEDIVRSYQLGVNSFIRKPPTFTGLVEALTIFGRYWLDIVELPHRVP